MSDRIEVARLDVRGPLTQASRGIDAINAVIDELPLELQNYKGSPYWQPADNTELVIEARTDNVPFHWENPYISFLGQGVLYAGNRDLVRTIKPAIFGGRFTIVALGDRREEGGRNPKWPVYDLAANAGRFSLRAYYIAEG